MEKDSALYQLMDTRMHSVMNGIVSSDGEYQAMGGGAFLGIDAAARFILKLLLQPCGRRAGEPPL